MARTTRSTEDPNTAIDAPMRAGTVWTMPARWYGDPDIHRAERERIFSRQWLWVGREETVSEPGRYLTAAPAGFPLFVRRGEDGALRGFHNVCRHRASMLLTEPSGRCDAIACPYHGWHYRSDGTLDHVPPPFGAAADFPKDELSLFPISVETWKDLVFVCLDRAAPPLASWLGPVARAIDRAAPARVVFDREAEFLVACNWKTYVDNYQEGYHIPPLHPGLNRDLDWKRYRVINDEGGSTHEAPAKKRSTHPGVFGWRFPNFAFSSYAEGLSFLRMEPVGPAQTRIVYHFYRPAGVSTEDFQPMVDYGIQISEEDQWIVPLIQRNLDAGIYERGPLSPRHENGVFHFHEMVRAALGGDGRAGAPDGVGQSPGNA